MYSERLLNYSLKIIHRTETIHFFKNILGMKVLRHTESSEDVDLCEDRWSKTMVGYGPENKFFALELNFDYKTENYSKGNAFIGITIRDVECLQRARIEKYPIVDGNVLFSPGGYKFIIINETPLPNVDPIVKISFGINNMKKAIDFWVKLLGLTVFKDNPDNLLVGFNGTETKLELRQIHSYIIKGENTGRLALGMSYDRLKDLEAKAHKSNRKILIPLTSIETPGRAKVNILALADSDGHENYFLEKNEFLSISKYSPNDEKLLNKMMGVEKQICLMLARDVRDSPSKASYKSTESLRIRAVNLLKNKAHSLIQDIRERKQSKIVPRKNTEIGTTSEKENLLGLTNLDVDSESDGVIKKGYYKQNKNIKTPSDSGNSFEEYDEDSPDIQSSKSDSITNIIKEGFKNMKEHSELTKNNLSPRQSASSKTSANIVKKSEENDANKNKNTKTSKPPLKAENIQQRSKNSKNEPTSSHMQAAINPDDLKKHNLGKKRKEAGKDTEGRDMRSDNAEKVQETKKEENKTLSKFDDTVRGLKSVTLCVDDSFSGMELGKINVQKEIKKENVHNKKKLNESIKNKKDLSTKDSNYSSSSNNTDIEKENDPKKEKIRLIKKILKEQNSEETLNTLISEKSSEYNSLDSFSSLQQPRFKKCTSNNSKLDFKTPSDQSIASARKRNVDKKQEPLKEKIKIVPKKVKPENQQKDLERKKLELKKPLNPKGVKANKDPQKNKQLLQNASNSFRKKRIADELVEMESKRRDEVFKSIEDIRSSSSTITIKIKKNK